MYHAVEWPILLARLSSVRYPLGKEGSFADGHGALPSLLGLACLRTRQLVTPNIPDAEARTGPEHTDLTHVNTWPMTS